MYEFLGCEAMAGLSQNLADYHKRRRREVDTRQCFENFRKRFDRHPTELCSAVQ